MAIQKCFEWQRPEMWEFKMEIRETAHKEYCCISILPKDVMDIGVLSCLSPISITIERKTRIYQRLHLSCQNKHNQNEEKENKHKTERVGCVFHTQHVGYLGYTLSMLAAALLLGDSAPKRVSFLLMNSPRFCLRR